MDRRIFLKTGGLLAGGAAGGLWTHRAAQAAMATSPPIPKFVAQIRRVGVDIPFSTTAGPSSLGENVDYYKFTTREFTDQILPGSFAATRLWGYTQEGQNPRHLGGLILARRNRPVHVRFTNQLPTTHFLPVDRTVMGAQSGPDNRTAVHLHGGKVPWVSDGGPKTWFSSADAGGSNATGPEFAAQQAALPSPPGSADYYYPNEQPARMMWYHDHAMGITRLNAYAGLASGYVLTDDGDAVLSTQHGLPEPGDPRTHHLVFQDKTFTSDGQLAYPVEYDPTMFALGPATQSPLPVPSSVPEFFGDTILVNGTSYPYLLLPQGAHRLRMLNACNGRFLTPRLFYAQASAPTEPNLDAPGPGFLQIGTEGGFLPTPVPVNPPSRPRLLLAPAERADVLVDLNAVPVGSVLILYNDAPSPFPNGIPDADHYPGNPATPHAQAGFGPNTRTLLQIVVTAPAGAAPMPTLPQDMRAYNDPLLVAPGNGANAAVPPGMLVRQVTLNEAFDAYGRLLPLLGTASADGSVPLAFDDPATEVVRQGTTEVWEIFNLTADAHPIHFHLVNVQLLNRQRLALQPLGRGRLPQFRPRNPAYLSRPTGVDANEAGWKETVRANPGEVTRVLMRFDPTASTLPFTVPTVSATDAAGAPYSGYSYVWHCHILEHEDRDMMRPLIVVP